MKPIHYIEWLTVLADSTPTVEHNVLFCRCNSTTHFNSQATDVTRDVEVVTCEACNKYIAMKLLREI